MRSQFIHQRAADLLVLACLCASLPLHAGRIFVPVPRGQGETLDTSGSRAEPPLNADRITTLAGDRIHGTVLESDAGVLRVSGSAFAGEVTVALEALRAVILHTYTPKAQRDLIQLVDGTRIACEVESVDKDSLVADSEFLGPFKMDVKTLEAIHIDAWGSMGLDSDFSSGELKPWTMVAGAWNFVEGGLATSSRRSWHALSTLLKQDRPMTVEVVIEAVSGSTPSPVLSMFCDQATGQYGRNSVACVIQNNQCHIVYTTNGNSENGGTGQMTTSFNGGSFRMAYDPANRAIKLWVGATAVFDQKLPRGPASGPLLMLGTRTPCKLASIRSFDGIVPPGQLDNTGRKEDSETVRFKNRDSLSVQSVLLEDGQFQFGTAAGVLQCAIDKVDRILFRKGNTGVPSAGGDRVLVKGGDSQVYVKFSELTRQHLIGESEHFGRVRIPRSSIREIEFQP